MSLGAGLELRARSVLLLSTPTAFRKICLCSCPVAGFRRGLQRVVRRPGTYIPGKYHSSTSYPPRSLSAGGKGDTWWVPGGSLRPETGE